jgi:hypothetical protein
MRGIAEHRRNTLERRLGKILEFRVAALHYDSVRPPEFQRVGYGIEVSSVFGYTYMPSGAFCVTVYAGKTFTPQSPRILEEKYVARFHFSLPIARSISENNADAIPESCI